jgi:hypothetical protein
MSKRQKFHISPHGDRWKLQKEGSQSPIKTFDTKREAVDFGRNKAKESRLGQLIIHKKDGIIQEERTYGKDLYPPKG